MYWDIILATIASIILGFSWYGPLFGKQWMAYMKVTPKQMQEAKKKGMPKSTYPIMIIGSLITAIVLSVLVPATAAAAVKMAAMLWLGFIAPIQLGMVLWEGRAWGYYLINVSYYLVSLVVQALIFAGFN